MRDGSAAHGEVAAAGLPAMRRKSRAACEAVGVDTTVEAIVWAVRHRLI